MKNRVGQFLFTILVIVAVVLLPAASAQDVQRFTVTDGGNTTEVMLPGFIDDISPASSDSSGGNQVISRSALKTDSMNSLNSSSEPQLGIEWANVLGASYSEEFASIHPTDDGGYIACGLTDAYYSNGDVSVLKFIGNGDMWVVKLDASGNPVWQNVYGGNKRDECRSVRPTSDGGYVMVGFSNSVTGEFAGRNNGEYDIYIVKTDSNGNKLWQQVLGEANTDVGTSIRQTSDGGYILTGFEDYSHSGKICQFTENSNAWVMKLNPDGSLQWKKKLAGDRGSHGTSIIEDRDGNYLMYGFTSSSSGDGISGNHGSDDLWVVKMDPTGAILWSRLYGGSGFEITSHITDDGIQQTTDGGFVLAGQTTSYRSGDVGTNHGAGDIWILKLNETGDINWTKTFGGSGYDMASGGIHQTPDEGYVFAGMTQSSNSGDVGENHGGWDYWVAKADQSGNLLWQDVLGGNNTEQCESIEPTIDGGYIVSGWTDSSQSGDVGYNSGHSDAWVVKLTPRFAVLVRDNDTKAFIPNATVGLYNYQSQQWQNVTTSNGPVAIKGTTGSNAFLFTDGSEYRISAGAEGYPQKNENVTFLFTDPEKEYFLKAFIALYDKSYSITCIENYDNICGGPGKTNCSINGSIWQCDNIAARLNSAGYKQNFYLKDGDVIRENFATDPLYTGHKLTESAFHYHTGHGGDSANHGLPLHKTGILLKGYNDISSIFDYVVAEQVSGKWGGKNKWVMLDSCHILYDDLWGGALTSSHGILGYTSQSWVRTNFGDSFFKNAIDEKMPIVKAYKKTTIELYQNDTIHAKVITKTLDQMEKDQFPGVGFMAPDGDPGSNERQYLNWSCKEGVTWW